MKSACTFNLNLWFNFNKKGENNLRDHSGLFWAIRNGLDQDPEFSQPREIKLKSSKQLFIFKHFYHQLMKWFWLKPQKRWLWVNFEHFESFFWLTLGHPNLVSLMVLWLDAKIRKNYVRFLGNPNFGQNGGVSSPFWSHLRSSKFSSKNELNHFSETVRWTNGQIVNISSTVSTSFNRSRHPSIGHSF